MPVLQGILKGRNGRTRSEHDRIGPGLIGGARAPSRLGQSMITSQSQSRGHVPLVHLRSTGRPAPPPPPLPTPPLPKTHTQASKRTHQGPRPRARAPAKGRTLAAAARRAAARAPLGRRLGDPGGASGPAAAIRPRAGTAEGGGGGGGGWGKRGARPIAGTTSGADSPPAERPARPGGKTRRAERQRARGDGRRRRRPQLCTGIPRVRRRWRSLFVRARARVGEWWWRWWRGHG